MTDTALAKLFLNCALDKKLKVSLLAYDYLSAFDTVSKAVMESKLGWMDPSASEGDLELIHIKSTQD